ncbi:hypothetical protein J7382_01040 [Shimia sp. R11_0]|uniref:hypothetical protein n=1 Tax=Shimia sp. R11_0 TaxID=2821096 RepID=UPI001ADCE181|nr:hypothetical protein [Shimia sp. R11_0]MBO9476106.1 hypothetical protein [Shimia sp. R11_0]
MSASVVSNSKIPAPAAIIRRSYLFIDAQHGLGNRMRALASAACIADATDRQLVVIWRRDHHCQADMVDVFDYAGPVVADDSDDVMRDSAAKVYNYMEIEPGAQFQEPVLPDPQRFASQHIYIRSAYTLNSPYYSWEHEDRFLHGLRPSQPVLDLLKQVPFPSDVSAHIRMATGDGFDHLSWEAPENWPAIRHEELKLWRAQSHVSAFITRLDALVAEGACDSLFVACDLPETYVTLQERYGDRLRNLPRDLYDRSCAQAQYALADMMLLARSKRFLASSGSSFSDVARRLAPRGCQFEQSGVDF